MLKGHSQCQQQQLIDLIDNHALDDFMHLYRACSTQLEQFEHVEILLRACRFGPLGLVRHILDDVSMVDVHCHHPSTGYSPLFIAIRGQQHDIIEYLLREKQMNVNEHFNNKVTPGSGTNCAQEAIHQQDKSILCLLLDHGAKVDQTHLFQVIMECLCPEPKQSLALEFLDVFIGRCPQLLQETEKQKIIDFLLHRADWPTFFDRRSIISLILNRLCGHELTIPHSNESPTTSRIHHTQVAIIGAGPAGLVLAELLSRSGIDSIVLECYSRNQVENIIRAGVLEQPTMDILDDIDTGERMLKKGTLQRQFHIQFDGETTTIHLMKMTKGKAMVMYGQQYVLQDLIQTRIKSGERLWFDIAHVQIERHNKTDDGHGPLIRFRRQDHNEEEEIHCDFIAGCDGAASPCGRRSIPAGVLQTIGQTYPYAWLSILADAPPCELEGFYAYDSQRGLAVHSLRSPTRVRFHLQVSVDDKLADWPDERIWSELKRRLKPINEGSVVTEGPILERAIFPLRSSVTLPMQYKRLFLAGDAAHVVPPTGAKGLNTAVKDSRLLAEAFIEFYETNRLDKLDNYTQSCSAHIWESQEFAHWMTTLLHKSDMSREETSTSKDSFEQHLQHARHQKIKNSYSLQQYISEMYTL